MRNLVSLAVLCFTVISLLGKCDSFSRLSRLSSLQTKSSLAMGLFDFFSGGDKKIPVKDSSALETTQVATSVKSDNADAASVRPLLAGTPLESRALKVVYRASKNGWDPKKFHSCVDSLGPAVVFAVTSDGLIVGGYNPKGWSGSGDNRPSTAAFLFVREKGSTASDAVKLRKVGGADSAIINDNQRSGIYFGPDALVIPLTAKPYGYPMIENSKMARSRLGSYYEKLTDGTKSVFAFGGGDRKGLLEATLADVVVLTGIYSKDEVIPFSFPL
jgi:TLD